MALDVARGVRRLRRMGLFSRKKRTVVTNLFVALDESAFASMLALCAEAEARIAAGGEDFSVASAEVARVAGALLDRLDSASHAAVFGEEFTDEDEAGAYGQQCFAELSTRYLAGPDDERAAPTEALPGERRVVVMLTVAYQGQYDALESPPGSVLELKDALITVVALHHRDALLLAHLHHAPAHPEDKLTDEQMLANYPELLSL